MAKAAVKENPMGAALAKLPEVRRKMIDSVRSDAWENEVTGFGTSRDKTTYTAFGGVCYLSDDQLAQLYHGDDIASRAVDMVPDEIFREGFEVDVGDRRLNQEIADQLEAINARTTLADGMRWGRAFGAGAVLIGADDKLSAGQPLEPERAAGISFLYDLDKRYLWPLTHYTEPGHPKLGRPETYLVSARSSRDADPVAVVHESRLILFGGATTGIREREDNNGWDRSILQRMFEVLKSFNTGWDAVEILLTDANQAVWKLQGLAESIAGGTGLAQAKSRMEVVDLYRSVLRAIVLDAGNPEDGSGAEDFERHSVSFESIPQVMDKMMLRLAAAVPAPVTLLFGQAPAGLNATGESDFRGFYDRIRAKQNLEIAPKIRRLVRVMLRGKDFAQDPERIVIKFPPLWSESPKDDSERKKNVAERDKVYIEQGVFTPEEVALVRGGPEGFDREITIQHDGEKARKAKLERDLEKMGEEPEEPDPMTVMKALAGEPGDEETGAPVDAPTSADPEDERTDALEAEKQIAALIERSVAALEGAERVVIVGGPRSGKGSIAVRASERYGLPVRHADVLVGRRQWSEASEDVSHWLDAPGRWILEGVTTGRAIRKWLARNPDKPFPATVVYLRSAIQVRSKRQRAMGEGVHTVFRGIFPELQRRGVKVIQRDDS